MFCYSCGTSLNYGVKFCSNCGVSAAVSPPNTSQGQQRPGRTVDAPRKSNQGEAAKNTGTAGTHTPSIPLNDADPITRFWNSLKTERSLQVAVIYTLLTIWDSMFWITWVDPFRGESALTGLFDFRNLYEWALPTAASVLLFLAWRKTDKPYFIWAAWTGGFVTLGLDFLVNGALGTSFLGLWELGDLVDLSGAVMLVVLFLRNRK